MTIWNGTDPLEPDHEVAYRGWPTERAVVARTDSSGKYPVVATWSGGSFTRHKADGKYYNYDSESALDLIPLQQEPGNE